MENCLTAAFYLDEYQGSSWDFYIYSRRSAIEQINEFMEPFARKVRKVTFPEDPGLKAPEESIVKDLEDSLLEGEWLIALFGPFPVKFDYEGTPELYDYHFIFREEGRWMHRDGKGAPIEPVDTEDLFGDFEIKEVQPQYFAVRRVEE